MFRHASRAVAVILLSVITAIGLLAVPSMAVAAGAPSVSVAGGWAGFLHPSVTATTPTVRSAATLAFECAADTPVSWNLSIKDDSGAIIRVFPAADGVCGTGESYHYSVSWDGTSDTGADLPDGSYLATATATDANGLTGALDLAVVIDTSLPGAITSPSPGASLSGPVDLVFTPAADVTIPELYFLLPDCIFWVHDVDPAGTMTAHQADITTCAGGDQQLVAKVHWQDSYGLAHVFTTAPVVVVVGDTTAPTLARNLQGLPRDSVVALTAPGQRSSVHLNFSCIDGSPVTWDFVIRNAVGETVRSFPSQDDLCQDWIDGSDPEVAWNGTDDVGAELPDGEYSLRAVVTDSAGQTGTLDETLFIQAAVPGVLAAPTAGSTLSGSFTYELVPTPGFPELDDITFGLQTPGLPGGVSGQVATPSDDGVFRFRQSLATIAAGPATITWSADWTDQFGADHWYNAAPSDVTIADVPVLAGVVSDRRGPLQGARVIIYDACTGRMISSTTTGADGSYRFPTVSTTSIKIKFAAPGHRDRFYNGRQSLRFATVVTLAAGRTFSADAVLRRR